MLLSASVYKWPETPAVHIHEKSKTIEHIKLFSNNKRNEDVEEEEEK